MVDNFYITTTLPYVNAKPHIGFGLEVTEADIIARYQKNLGKEVIFNTGTDEHGQKIYEKALEMNLSPQDFCDNYVKEFKDLKTILNLSYTNFIRTSSSVHKSAAQEFWRRSKANGDIYLAQYQMKYCVGCELEKTESELFEGRCPLHPDQELDLRDETNYFFRFSKFQKPLLSYFQNNPDFVHPESRMKEALAFIEQGLKDFSISRLKSKMPWGIPVPDDPDHVMYVWFDALVNYISTLGWPNSSSFSKFWPGVQVAGKDNLRQQAIMWQAMLLSVNLPCSKKILINGFISINGQKMSKSLGNVITPKQMADRYGSDATRFLLISLGTFSEDMDVTWQRLDDMYTSYLSNGLGNLCSRIAKMAADQKMVIAQPRIPLDVDFQKMMDNYQLFLASKILIQQISKVDLFLSNKKPWNLSGSEKIIVLEKAVYSLLKIAHHLNPFMPETSNKILAHFQGNVEPISPLFPRLVT